MGYYSIPKMSIINVFNMLNIMLMKLEFKNEHNFIIFNLNVTKYKCMQSLEFAYTLVHNASKRSKLNDSRVLCGLEATSGSLSGYSWRSMLKNHSCQF